MSDCLTKPKSTPRGGVLVLHAWWGLNEFQRGLCARLASEGYVALAPDLYDGATARTIPEARKLRTLLKRDVASRHILRALKDLQAETQSGRVGVMGFSLGASWSLWLAAHRPRSLAATILFYGTRSGDYARTRSAFVGHFAEKDEYESRSGRQKLEKALIRAGNEVTFFEHPDTQHWFVENDRPEFSAAAAKLAWKRTIETLRHHVAPV